MGSFAGGTLGDFTKVEVGPTSLVVNTENITVSITGIFVGTVSIQCSFDGDSFVEIDSVNMPALVPSTGVLAPMHSLRAECTMFTSGTIEVRFGGRRVVGTNVLSAVS